MLTKQIDAAIRTISDFPKPGIQFKDITPIFLNNDLCNEISHNLANQARGKVDVVCGVESRGFLFGIQIASILNLPFVMIRKAGKLPGDTYRQEYSLEYGSGSIEVHKGFIQKNQRVLIHDDLLATGGTAAASAQLVKQCGAIPAQFSFVIELKDLCGKQLLEPYTTDIYSLLIY